MSPENEDPLHRPFHWEEASLGIPMEGKLFKDLKKAAELKQICEKFDTADYPTAVKDASQQRLTACMKKRITVMVQGQALLKTAKLSKYDFSDVEPRIRNKVKKYLLKKNSKAFNTARELLPKDEARDNADWEVVEHLFINASYYGLTHRNVTDALSISQWQGTTRNGEAIACQKVYLLEKAQTFYNKLMTIGWPFQNARMDQDVDLGVPMNGRFFKDLKTEVDFNAVTEALVQLECPSVGGFSKEPDETLRCMKKRITVLTQRYACKKFMPDAIKDDLAHRTQFMNLHRINLRSIVNAWKPLSADDKEAVEQKLVNHLFSHAAHFGLMLTDMGEAFTRPNTIGSEVESDSHKLLQNLAEKADLICAAIPHFQGPGYSEEPTDVPMGLTEYQMEAEA